MRRSYKRVLCCVLCSLLLLGAAPAYASVFHADVRVLLSVSREQITIDVRGTYTLQEDPSFVIPEGESVVTILGNRPLITSAGNTFSAPSLTLLSGDYNGTETRITLKNDKYGSTTYLGNMTFDVRQEKLRAINTLPVEKYLYGVIAYEMSNTFPLEALKAQAVCARAYAVSRASTYSQRTYDINDTSSDQVYHGYVARYTRAIKAADATAGKVLLYDGDIIEAYYSASNGGQTELTGNVWKENYPYYIHQDDPYDLDNPSSLEETSFIPGTFDDATRAFMDAMVLDALQKGADAAAGTPVTLLKTICILPNTPKYDPPSRSFTMADAVLLVTDGSKTGQVRVTLDLAEFVHTGDHYQGIFNADEYTLRMRGAEPGVYVDKETEQEYAGWFLTNRRYGHGIGLSQRGAQRRAVGGQTYEDIVSFYYTGTALATVGSFSEAPKLTSSRYAITESYVSGIDPDTRVSKLLGRVEAEGEAELSVVDPKGLPREDTLCTGDNLRLLYDGGASILDIPIVIYGDTNCDGAITEADVAALLSHLSRKQPLSGACLSAADVDHDGKVTLMDALNLGRSLNDDYTIKQQEEKQA